jgi:hypothetical protein
MPRGIPRIALGDTEQEDTKFGGYAFKIKRTNFLWKRICTALTEAWKGFSEIPGW